MNADKLFRVSTRKEWREWLSNNFEKEKEIWVVFPKKSSGIRRIPYIDAVEEALCFGWIDSIVKTLDQNNSIQRFTPCNPRSSHSQANKERIKWLYSNNLLHPSVKKEIKNILKEKFVFPDDIIRKDKIAWANFNKF